MARRVKPYLRGSEGLFVSSREIEIVTRKEYPTIQVRVGRLERRTYPYKPVSSTNIAGIGYDLIEQILEVGFLGGKRAVYYFVPFEVFEEFYYAHSKGTFFYHRIRLGGYEWSYV